MFLAARPPTAIPPYPTVVSTEEPTMIHAPTTDDNEKNRKNRKSVGLEIYAIDYTLSQTDRTLIKIDFLELQKVTESYLKDYIVDAYQESTQAILVDFTTSFVTAHLAYVNL